MTLLYLLCILCSYIHNQLTKGSFMKKTFIALSSIMVLGLFIALFSSIKAEMRKAPVIKSKEMKTDQLFAVVMVDQSVPSHCKYSPTLQSKPWPELSTMFVLCNLTPNIKLHAQFQSDDITYLHNVWEGTLNKNSDAYSWLIMEIDGTNGSTIKIFNNSKEVAIGRGINLLEALRAMQIQSPT